MKKALKNQRYFKRFFSRNIFYEKTLTGALLKLDKLCDICLAQLNGNPILSRSFCKFSNTFCYNQIITKQKVV